MKTNPKLTHLVITFSPWKWLQPALLTLAVAIVLAGITGCQPAHH